MWAASTAIWCAIVGVVFCATISRERRADENTADYAVKPQLFNQLLQELIEKDKLPTKELKTQDQQYQALLQEQFQSQFDDQFQKQLQNQAQAPQPIHIEGKTSQTILQIPEKSGLVIDPYQSQTAVHYKQPISAKFIKQLPQQQHDYEQILQQYQQLTAQQYNPQPSQQQPLSQYNFNQPPSQHHQPQPYQVQKTEQDQRGKVLGVDYSSAADSSKTTFSGYGINYSF